MIEQLCLSATAFIESKEVAFDERGLRNGSMEDDSQVDKLSIHFLDGLELVYSIEVLFVLSPGLLMKMA